MLASSIIRDARRTGLAAEALTPVGSLRPFAPSVDDVVLLMDRTNRMVADVVNDLNDYDSLGLD